jgi:hypothetical protein
VGDPPTAPAKGQGILNVRDQPVEITGLINLSTVDGLRGADFRE